MNLDILGLVAPVTIAIFLILGIRRKSYKSRVSTPAIVVIFISIVVSIGATLTHNDDVGTWASIIMSGSMIVLLLGEITPKSNKPSTPQL